MTPDIDVVATSSLRCGVSGKEDNKPSPFTYSNLLSARLLAALIPVRHLLQLSLITPRSPL